MGKVGTKKKKSLVASNPAAMEQCKSLFDIVKLSNVSMVACRAIVLGETSGALYLRLGREQPRGYRSSDKKKLHVEIKFMVEGRLSDKDKDDVILLIEETLRASYEIPEEKEFDKVAMDLFACTNGTFSLWPYWREFVQTTSLRMGLPGLTVPSYRIEEAFTGPGSVDRADDKPRRHGARKRSS